MLFFKVVCVLALVLGYNADIVAAGPPHFQQWFPQFASDLETTLQDACSTEFQHYHNEVGLHANIENPLGCHANSINPLGCLAGAVVDCMLSNTNESTKANFASAAVLLGIMPTTLGLVGSNTVETALLALRRPILALLLAGGAPTVSPLRTFDYGQPHKVLSRPFKHRRFPDLKSSPRLAVALVLFEYVCTGGAVVNLAHVCWQLSNLAICGFSPETAYLPLLWAFLALVIHIFGAITNRFRISLRPIKGTAVELFMREFQLNACLPPTTLEFKQESYTFIFFSWFTSTGSVLHIMFGTLVFSSILFISTRDAAYVVLRFVLSAVICRAVLMLELSGMRGCVVVEKHEDELADVRGYQELVPLTGAYATRQEAKEDDRLG